MLIGFEGPDFAGKSSVSNAVATALSAPLYQNPGATGLGNQLRPILKKTCPDADSIKFCPLSRQLLYMSDYTNFLSQIVRPAVDRGETIILDRVSTIGIVVYGLLEDIPVHKIANLLQIVAPPKLDRLYVLLPTAEQLAARAAIRGISDDFDRQMQRILTLYRLAFDKYTTLIQLSVSQNNIVILPNDRDVLELKDLVLRDVSNLSK